MVYLILVVSLDIGCVSGRYRFFKEIYAKTTEQLRQAAEKTVKESLNEDGNEEWG